LNAMSAALTITATASNWAKVSAPCTPAALERTLGCSPAASMSTTSWVSSPASLWLVKRTILVLSTNCFRYAGERESECRR
jgi:hypothetical protein